ncbi:hypothetical protein LIP_3058 [Limnochorda pilosa]|uniref:Lipid-A-disaccharide synthase n=2 Tax=Limnochorda pilosa TaxID=1555112 RepID=A0A0K2SPF9_LIMPI|nr:hypothetical protein LIP_3058 [Limnochorda pilosa]
MRLLVLSNGHGEDLLARTLVSALQARAAEVGVALEVWAFPLVGEGLAWTASEPGRRAVPEPLGAAAEERGGRPWKVVGVQAAMPSGGFLLEGSGGLWKDLRAGLLGLAARQARSVRGLGRQADWVLAVGDVVPLAAGILLARRPTVFVSTAKSERIRGFGRAERRLMRRARLVFARDPESARALADAGVPARYAGNLMMDALEAGPLPEAATDGLVVALLPGSHADAYDNLAVMGRVAMAVAACWPGPARFLVPLAAGLDPVRAQDALASGGWRAAGGPPQEGPGAAPAAEAGGRWFETGSAARGGPLLWMGQGLFGSVLHGCHLVVGLAGTANEQAAGLGKPVVTFPGPGIQATEAFLADQRRLLGEAVVVAPPDPDAVAREICRIASDPAAYRRMSEAGRAVMGRAGAAGRMAGQIVAAFGGGEGPFGPAEKIRP